MDRSAESPSCIPAKVSAGAHRGGFARRVSLRLAVLALVLGGLGGCDYLAGRTVSVEFASAPGIQAEEPVYFAGVLVGKTGEPQIVQGKVHVPVQLMRRHKDALPKTTAFAISTVPDGSEERCLVGHDVGAVLPVDAVGADGVYRGFATEFELTLLVGAKKAKDFFESLPRQP